jgi:hypothetical protein
MVIQKMEEKLLLTADQFVKFEVAKKAIEKIAVFWVAASCSLAVYRRFRGTSCHHN